MFKQKLIYVCSPLRGNIEKNIARAKEYCRSVIIAGYVPLAPHVALNGVLDDNKPAERETALALGLELLQRCNELWVFGSVVSMGMAAEIDLAQRLNIPVKRVLFDNSLTPEPTTHEVKILPKYFEQVQSGAKTFEYRKDDRGYKVGDIIKLREYQPESDTYTGSSLEAEITYILKGGELNIPTGYAIMSINKIQGGV
ncbi:MAG: ASCH/PUA domain-containing protein [Oscillospiraceae bacterium]